MAEIRKSAKDFEAMFMSEMFSHMSEGVETDPVFGGGHGEDIYRSMLTQEYGRIAANSPNGAGLTDSLVRQMVLMQQQANAKGAGHE